jgi:outer membrane receptor for ferrienterochelin and colicin
MLRKFAILLCCGFLSTSIHAQNFGGGLILGLSSSQVSGDKLGGFNKAGILAGVFAKKSISENLSIQMEITYIQKGSRNPDNTTPHEYDLDYVEIPLFLKYQTKYQLKIEAGFLTGILINQIEYSNGMKLTNISNGNFNKFDFGIGIGIDYSISEKLTLNSRISNTLFFSPTREYSVQTFINRGNYNSVLSFAIHYNL